MKRYFFLGSLIYLFIALSSFGFTYKTPEFWLIGAPMALILGISWGLANANSS